MALNAAQTILPGRGLVFYGAPNLAPPNKATINPATPSTYTGWTCMGHTSRDNAVALTKEGGETTVRGSWWDDALRSTTSPVVLGSTINSLQVDKETLDVAFPGGRVIGGGYAVGSVGTIEKAVYILMVDGSSRAGIYAPRQALTLGDAPSIDVENFFEIQIGGPWLSATAAVVKGSDTICQVGETFWLEPPVALT